MNPDGTPPWDLTAEELARRAAYSAEHIQVLNSMDAVRLRPGMYVGGVDSPALHRLFGELLTIALGDEPRGAGHTIRVSAGGHNSLTLATNHPRAELQDPAGIERLVTRLFVPGTHYDSLHLLAANAISEWFWIETTFGGQRYHQEFRRGLPVTQPTVVTGGVGQSLALAFRPDPTIFQNATFDPDVICERLRECAFLNAGVRFTFTNDTNKSEELFESAGGVVDFVRWLNADSQPLHPEVLFTRGEVGDVRYEVAMQWCRRNVTVDRLYVNDRYAQHGGTPITGLRTGVMRVVNGYIRKHLPDAVPVKGQNILNGMAAVVSVRMTDPLFEGALRWRLGNPEAEAILAAAVGELLRREFAANPAVAEQIARAAIADAEAEATEKRRRKKKP